MKTLFSKSGYETVIVFRLVFLSLISACVLVQLTNLFSLIVLYKLLNGLCCLLFGLNGLVIIDPDINI